MRFRVTYLVGMALFAAAAFGLYLVKYSVQNVKSEVIAREIELKNERESLHLLQAEWAYLTRPERITRLAELHLKLTPLRSAQITQVDGLPAALPDAQTMPGLVTAAGSGAP
jgi:hypothetical protein